MRWTFRLGFVALIAFALFTLWPFWALYRLAEAVEARDLAGIEARVEFTPLRHNLTRQVIGAYLRSIGRGAELDRLGGQAAAGVGATIADPLVARFLTPEALKSLLAGAVPAQDGAAPVETGAGLDLGDVDQALRLFVESESRGFTNLHVPVRTKRSGAEPIRLHLRLRAFRWRLRGIELPEGVLQELAARLPRPSS